MLLKSESDRNCIKSKYEVSSVDFRHNALGTKNKDEIRCG